MGFELDASVIWAGTTLVVLLVPLLIARRTVPVAIRRAALGMHGTIVSLQPSTRVRLVDGETYAARVISSDIEAARGMRVVVTGADADRALVVVAPEPSEGHHASPTF